MYPEAYAAKEMQTFVYLKHLYINYLIDCCYMSLKWQSYLRRMEKAGQTIIQVISVHLIYYRKTFSHQIGTVSTLEQFTSCYG